MDCFCIDGVRVASFFSFLRKDAYVVKVLFRVILAFISLNEEHILTIQNEETLFLFLSDVASSSFDCDTLMKVLFASNTTSAGL